MIVKFVFQSILQLKCYHFIFIILRFDEYKREEKQLQLSN